MKKRFFDIVISIIGLLLCWPILIFGLLVSIISTHSYGVFIQIRVGQFGRLFKVYKLQTMIRGKAIESPITALNSNRITKGGLFLRKYKIDELPQLFNVLFGDMSFVGPRPDVPGYADLLTGNDRLILSIRPGITGPASIKYKNEEDILIRQNNPKEYNDRIIWPDKVKINRQYFDTNTLFGDIKYIIKTLRR
ncbi:sugar transferase [Colwellia hornerae]|uniref:Sugar transferase n=1 Tax=Colwellia hornerae TaxID=89402 RepID=A0A5C6QKJ4_9GAMM|nr:sugar transferase [Colwellia hornerae]TWX54045.1 sugar transferase [Colwellia hornerae]TWX60820.1 sugar transferase [Colwellia hornerae]TWX69150.1 sugar transferase [Colwellia hornerae]